jgi:predicted regulator of Ras-like GTPase activity (Roadblock/LC7/MglB family)
LVFRPILSDLVASVDGALAALFIDHQGEAVDAVGLLPDYDLKVIGAYQGIFLTQMEAIGHAIPLGGLERLKIEWEDSTILNALVDDEYYLILVLRSGANEGIAWNQLARTRERIREEM